MITAVINEITDHGHMITLVLKDDEGQHYNVTGDARLTFAALRELFPGTLVLGQSRIDFEATGMLLERLAEASS